MSDQNPPQPNEQPIPAGRGGDIEIVCFFGFLVALFVIRQAFGEMYRQGASWRSLLGIAFPLVFTVCLIGFWKMRRWAVFTYTGAWICAQILLLLTGHWNILTVPVPALVIAVGFRNLWKMR